MTAEFSRWVKRAALEQSGGYCAVCGRPLMVAVFHHRLPRKMGGTRRAINTVEYCLPVHDSCHRYIHSHPSESYMHGWLLRDVEQWGGDAA